MRGFIKIAGVFPVQEWYSWRERGDTFTCWAARMPYTVALAAAMVVMYGIFF